MLRHEQIGNGTYNDMTISTKAESADLLNEIETKNMC